jgi:hypothetical protein
MDQKSLMKMTQLMKEEGMRWVIWGSSNELNPTRLSPAPVPQVNKGLNVQCGHLVGVIKKLRRPAVHVPDIAASYGYIENVHEHGGL